MSAEVAGGTLTTRTQGHDLYITKTDATRWISRGCPVGETQRSWISIATAGKRYLFTEQELNAFIAQRKLKKKTGTQGAMRGIVYVPQQQCANLREQIGFTPREAARRAGVTVTEFRKALAGVNWRGSDRIPLVTVQVVIKRLQSRPGQTIEDAAKALGRDVAWVEDRINDGTVRLLRRRWDADRLYLSEPMMRRLRNAAANPELPKPLGKDWLRLGEAAMEAGVTAATIMKWASNAELERIHGRAGWRYPPERRSRPRARLLARYPLPSGHAATMTAGRDRILISRRSVSRAALKQQRRHRRRRSGQRGETFARAPSRAGVPFCRVILPSAPQCGAPARRSVLSGCGVWSRSRTSQASPRPAATCCESLSTHRISQ